MQDLLSESQRWRHTTDTIGIDDGQVAPLTLPDLDVILSYFHSNSPGAFRAEGGLQRSESNRQTGDHFHRL